VANNAANTAVSNDRTERRPCGQSGRDSSSASIIRGLLAAAVKHELVVMIDRSPGSFVVEGTPLGSFWGLDGRMIGSDSVDSFGKALAGSVHLGPERTATQDFGYGLRQLVDVANKGTLSRHQ
jgi:uncharacterized membrane protein